MITLTAEKIYADVPRRHSEIFMLLHLLVTCHVFTLHHLHVPCSSSAATLFGTVRGRPRGTAKPALRDEP